MARYRETEKGQGYFGVIQGYNGIAVSDSKNQVIVAANAYGSVSEGQYFVEMLEETERNMRTVKEKKKPLEGAVMLGDNTFCVTWTKESKCSMAVILCSIQHREMQYGGKEEKEGSIEEENTVKRVNNQTIKM